MKKIKCLLFVFCVCLLSACQSNDNVSKVNEQQSVSVPNETISSDGKILIAYFTWADNTHVDDPSSVDVDASTSASVLAPGNTKKVAHFIQEQVGGDMFSIIVDEPYSSDYDECLDRASDELAQQTRPTIVDTVKNMDEYDVIFLGYPNWWSSCPMAIFSFIESYDLSNKTIIPFCAHGTGGLGRSIEDLQDALPHSTLLDAFGVYRPDTDSCQDDVNQWLSDIGMVD